MNRRIVLPLFLVLLLIATILVFSIFLPRVTFLVDISYSKTVLAVQRSKLFFSLLQSGYILTVEEVSLMLDPEQLLDVVDERSLFVIASPLVSSKLKNTDIPVNVVGQGRSTEHASTFQYFWLIDDETMLNHLEYPDLLNALVGEADAERFSAYFPSDLVFLKGNEEIDSQFAERMSRTLQERQVITVVAPSLGSWAISLLQDASMQWVVPAEYLSMIPPKQQSGVLVPDLVAGVKALLAEKDEIYILKWRMIKL
ncbi:hypothetical protein [uncultured Sphaerochaeta sp.]|uniref:hypothetical protein n=1 Tax=uncultured Sphaerochaeta sp. TaxID=886478 RepID=UPI0029CA0E37|nr:hypothetical protein [uncultured Sphaerochaeta sp.]